MDDILRTIIYKGNETEVQYGLKMLYQLCFDSKILKHVHDDKDLLSKLSELEKSSNEAIKKNANGINWLIHKKLMKENEDEIKKLTESAKDKHVMISYNRDSRDLCLKIKSELEKLNYKVWIDVEAISGSSLESMSNAIENSFCVLMCMTEKYKQSSNCRAEAEYAFQLNKPIVPLIMQANYKPDGWLGKLNFIKKKS